MMEIRVETGTSSDEALRKGLVDLWPEMVRSTVENGKNCPAAAVRAPTMLREEPPNCIFAFADPFLAGVFGPFELVMFRDRTRTMSRYYRHSWFGLAAGLASSLALIATQDNTLVAIVLAAVIGMSFEVLFRHTRHAYMDSLMTGAAFGIPMWASISVIIFPIISGQMPQWSAAGMRALVHQLTGWVLYGASVGILLQALRDLISLRAPLKAEAAPRILPSKHIVILGGGFGGTSTAESLEHLFGADESVEFILVSETNALLFTPMLAEVAGSSLEPTHISSPLRTSLHRTHVIRGKASRIDLEGRGVTIRLGDGSATQTLTYDHLVLALGSISNYLGLENVQRHAFDFKSLLDAIRIRNHVIDMFERADREADHATRQEALTFVVAGGGFAGVELAGALNDFGRGMLADYPSLSAEDLRVILVHSRERILPELSEPLAAYALDRMRERGVTFKLNARLADAGPGAVVLKPDEEIRAQTLVWTAGTTPNPLLKTLPVEHDKRGAVIVDSMLAVPGFPGVWALGDCAAVTDSKTGKPCPPTAQFALREARTVAKNIYANLRGKPLTSFHFDSLGALCVVGHQTACAELIVPFARNKSLMFSGLMAWMMWRSIYLAKLPGLERKARVMVDWIMELFFPRDIVQTIDLSALSSIETAQPPVPETGPGKVA
jgi:NADH:ubiquinone reductase (H+-translocating)